MPWLHVPLFFVSSILLDLQCLLFALRKSKISKVFCFELGKIIFLGGKKIYIIPISVAHSKKYEDKSKS